MSRPAKVNNLHVSLREKEAMTIAEYSHEKETLKSSRNPRKNPIGIDDHPTANASVLSSLTKQTSDQYTLAPVFWPNLPHILQSLS